MAHRVDDLSACCFEPMKPAFLAKARLDILALDLTRNAGDGNGYQQSEAGPCTKTPLDRHGWQLFFATDWACSKLVR